MTLTYDLKNIPVGIEFHFKLIKILLHTGILWVQSIERIYGQNWILNRFALTLTFDLELVQGHCLPFTTKLNAN